MRPATRKSLFLLPLAVGLVWLLDRGLSPLDHGINARAFEPDARDSMPASNVILRQDPVPGNLPNIIVILADDLGWGDLGVQGATAIQTPHIDRLAAQGVRMTNFYASAPICTPSRAGLLTGRYPVRSGFGNVLAAADDTVLRKTMMKASTALSKLGMTDMIGGESITRGLPESEITIAEALKIQGYRTLQIGKWHLGDFTQLPQFHPQNQGFDHSYGYNMSNDDWPVALWRDQQELVEDIGIDQVTHTADFTAEAVRYIREWKDGPFFIYLAHKDPHQPFFTGERFAGTSDAGPFGDAVSEFDWSVGEVVRTLQEEGIAENTLLLLTSDNGPWYQGSAGALRGRKGQSYEGGFRVPFIAVWPGQLDAGVVLDTPAMNIDIFPTLLHAAGLKNPLDRTIDGIDLLALMRQEADATRQAQERPLFFFHEFDVEAVRVGNWKLIRGMNNYVWPVPMDKPDNVMGRMLSGRDYYPPGGAEPVPTLAYSPLLFNLASDPGESYNLAPQHTDVVRNLRQMIEGFHRETMAAPRGWIQP